jgi:NAD(P)-dependent dehydrogenase (short-subunit alcohol dehydrogenase family)
VPQDDILHTQLTVRRAPIYAAELRFAAMAAGTDAVDVSLEVSERTLEVNLRGYLLLTRHAVPAMLERGRGAIVYTSSGAAFVGEGSGSRTRRPRRGVLNVGGGAAMR